MPKLYYIANIRLPTEKAHGIQIMEMCAAFAKQSFDVELVVPDRKTPIAEDPFDYYGIPRDFTVSKLWCADPQGWGRIGFMLQTLTFVGGIAWRMLGKKGLFYTRDEILASLLVFMGKHPVWEAHMGQTNFFARSILRSSKLVVITEGLKNLYESLGVPASRIRVAPDAVHVSEFDLALSREEARRKLALSADKKIVLYTGHLYSWKGADTLARAAALLPAGTEVIFVGGTADDVRTFKEKYGNIPQVKILGKKPHAEMPLYMRAADVLVIPNSAKEDISKLYTSPMKLFEYMASRTPIVASDLPSLREIIGEPTAFFFTPDEPESLAKAIMEALTDAVEAGSKAERARTAVEKYSWQKRAEEIIAFIS